MRIPNPFSGDGDSRATKAAEAGKRAIDAEVSKLAKSVVRSIERLQSDVGDLAYAADRLIRELDVIRRTDTDRATSATIAAAAAAAAAAVAETMAKPGGPSWQESAKASTRKPRAPRKSKPEPKPEA